MAKALFDRNEVIEKSMNLFWKNGFSGSSMQQIVETTGLKPGSIYHSFGNKEALFREVLEAYSRKSREKIRNTLDNARSVGEGICNHLEGVVEQATEEGYNSCLLVKTQLELAAKSEESDLHAFTSSMLKEVEQLFKSYLEREFNEKVSQDRATSIMLHIFGMRVYGYHKGEAERMRQGMRAGLPWLPWQ
jgi:TetR/AcrR family transcriptional repressor of nem operon